MGGGRRGEGVTNEVRGTSERNEVEMGRWGGGEEGRGRCLEVSDCII